jgi:hypothetical protein
MLSKDLQGATSKTWRDYCKQCEYYVNTMRIQCEIRYYISRSKNVYISISEVFFSVCTEPLYELITHKGLFVKLNAILN